MPTKSDAKTSTKAEAQIKTEGAMKRYVAVANGVGRFFSRWTIYAEGELVSRSSEDPLVIGASLMKDET